jgi:starch synthase (maltosyl-transferring)
MIDADLEGRRRVVIEAVTPEIDAGRFPIKRVVGETVVVEADIFTDGHDAISAVLRYQHCADRDAEWHETRCEPLVNDRWRATFRVEQLGCYRYTLVAWVDRFKTWSRDFAKRVEAGQDLHVELLIGAQLVEEAALRATDGAEDALGSYANSLRSSEQRANYALSPDLAALMERYPDRALATTYPRELLVTVDPLLARFSAWYELFPRSLASQPGGHGTLKDVAAQLPRIAALGFNVLYLPPIHPIGSQFRKGPNNTTTAGPDDPGSPWAIGGLEGGHLAVHPQLGTLQDVRDLARAAREQGIELALDIALQASPDHPYAAEHVSWFRQRPDGTIQYAENPPKKYQDIYPFDFETPDWRALWEELLGVVRFWIEQGVSVFRVDNPHTKPFAFWEWLIGEVKSQTPAAIFLAEAFTRPKVMAYLAKAGFTQSYTYFTWRNTAWELREYLTQLTQTELAEYFRPNFWPNTPDILPEHLQVGGRPAFIARLVLAATLSSNYGIYGPAFELLDNAPLAPGREEYLHSEKYEIKRWQERPDHLRDLITLVNRIRIENPALQTNTTLRFHPTTNDQLLAYSKVSPDGDNAVLIVVNLDPNYTQSGFVDLALDELGVDAEQPYQMHDLIGQGRYLWHGARNYIELNPHITPAHIFRIRHRVRTERDFDYFA